LRRSSAGGGIVLTSANHAQDGRSNFGNQSADHPDARRLKTRRLCSRRGAL
jgi:hypothetical protein